MQTSRGSRQVGLGLDRLFEVAVLCEIHEGLEASCRLCALPAVWWGSVAAPAAVLATIITQGSFLDLGRSGGCLPGWNVPMPWTRYSGTWPGRLQQLPVC
jgi:hypothetical protein